MGPQQREFHREIQQAKQVGVGPNKKNFNVNSTSLTPLLD
ncbi:hypothetical protein HMPREF0791_1840 [Staphylococcus epidermidis W23144]|nr:hypothetical protein HMPREF0791_1840 [Staphylococcus epidermidis W23144]